MGEANRKDGLTVWSSCPVKVLYTICSVEDALIFETESEFRLRGVPDGNLLTLARLTDLLDH